MISIYFQHDVLTPGNTRRAWHDAIAVPSVTDEVHLDEFGYMGSTGTWRVANVLWQNATSVVVTLTDGIMSPPSRAMIEGTS